MIGKLERLAAAGIELVPVASFPNHFVFARDGFASLVERVGEDFGAIGAAGLITERGLALLVWRGGKPVFVGKGVERPATSEQVQSLRSFADDLKAALSF